MVADSRFDYPRVSRPRRSRAATKRSRIKSRNAPLSGVWYLHMTHLIYVSKDRVSPNTQKQETPYRQTCPNAPFLPPAILAPSSPPLQNLHDLASVPCGSRRPVSLLFLLGLASSNGGAGGITGSIFSSPPPPANILKGHAITLKTCLASAYPALVCSSTSARTKGTQTQTIVTAKRQSCGGIVNSVMPKTDCRNDTVSQNGREFARTERKGENAR